MTFGSAPRTPFVSAYCFPFVVSFLLFYTLFDFSLPESAAPAILSVESAVHVRGSAPPAMV